jgi:CYTH domain-containing protein
VAGVTVAIDAFEGDARGLVLAEVDLRDRPDVELRLPFSTIAEVTDDDRYQRPSRDHESG